MHFSSGGVGLKTPVPSWVIDSDTRPLDSDTQSLCYVYAMIVVIARNDWSFSKAFLAPKQLSDDDELQHIISSLGIQLEN